LEKRLAWSKIMSISKSPLEPFSTLSLFRPLAPQLRSRSLTRPVVIDHIVGKQVSKNKCAWRNAKTFLSLGNFGSIPPTLHKTSALFRTTASTPHALHESNCFQ
jgi:hypothetical protein